MVEDPIADSRPPPIPNQRTNGMNDENSLTRVFVIVLKQAVPDPQLDLNNIPQAGRVDLLCRVLTSAFFLSNSFRPSTEVWAFFQQNALLIKFRGDKFRGVQPDERSVGGFLRRVFRHVAGVGKHANKPIMGVSWQLLALEDLPELLPQAYILEQDGELATTKLSENDGPVFFVLGDHVGFSDEDKLILGNYPKISLGQTELLTSQCITVLHYLMDVNQTTQT